MSTGFEFTSSLISFVIALLTITLFYGAMNRFNEGKLKMVLRHLFYSLLLFVLGQFFIVVMVYLDFNIEVIYGMRAFFVIAVAIGLIITSFEALRFGDKFGMKHRRIF